MKLKKYNFVDVLNEIDDSIIEKSISINDAEKLKEEKKKYKEKKKMNIFSFIPACAGAVCALAIGVFCLTGNFGNVDDNKNIIDERVQIASPILEVETKEEMKKYLGFDVPNVNSKEVETYIVVGHDGYADLGRILYNDDSEFRIAYKFDGELSGIYGSTLEETKKINGTDVEFYTYENIRYATWKNGDFEYSYMTSIDDENITSFIEEMMDEIGK